MSYTNGLDKPSDYFTTKLYSGNSSTQSITGLDFQPDWVWCKVRSQADNHAIFDSVRGGQKQLRSNTTDAELARTNAISSFNSDGWSMGSQPEMNTNGQTYASWNWKAGTSFTNDASGTGIGSIDSTGSVNTDAGFSIVSFTGTGANATVAHGLGAIPKMFILKCRTQGDRWVVYHNSLGNTHYLSLDRTAAAVDQADQFNDTSPTSSVFSIGSSGQVSGTGETFIAYCFAEKKGYSKFGSYTGNGNADGTFVYTGFKPAFVIIKPSSYANSWLILDNKRNTFNPTNTRLEADGTGADNSGLDYTDFLSNGFKIRTSNSHPNNSGETLIYMAFAENPFVTSTGVPATAR